MKYSLDQHLLFAEVISDNLWDFKKLLQNPAVVFEKSKSRYINWELYPDKVYEFRYDVFGIENELIDRLEASSFSQMKRVLITLGSGNPILEFDTAYFIKNWEELVFLSRHASLVWSKDSKYILEFNGKYDKLYSNFLF